MKLIIAEKPMLARAIADAIPGKAVSHKDYTEKGGYTIVSAFGHLLTLKEPEDYDAGRYKRWSLSALPIWFEDWGKKPGNGKEERLNLIGSLLKEADEVIHAGDPDDEGQYLIDEILNWFEYKGPVYRLATGDTTEAALAKALANLKDNNDYVNQGWSAHARSVADIMVGFNFSRYFSLKNPQIRLLTVGRVQTPTLGLVVTRDLAIENHSKQSYCTVNADLQLQGKTVRTRLELPPEDAHLTDGKLTDAAYAQQLAEALKGRQLDPVTVSAKPITEPPPLPFNLVKLQTYCSNKFGYDPSQTLAITQSLRDNHNAITYNRSDCQYLSEEQFKQSPGTIRQVLANLQNDPAGAVFSRLPLDPQLHSRAFDDNNITAHTAIIPQARRLDLTKLSEQERNVYLAIVKYYMAQFLPPAQKERTTLEAATEFGTLKASSTRVCSKGYLRLMGSDGKAEKAENEEEENDLSSIAPGTYTAMCTATDVEKKETKAPPRYTKASLNEDMTRIARYVTDPEAKALLLAKDKDKKGENGSIGTSATRASIIDNLEARGFIETKGKKIQSTPLGRELYRILPDELKKPDMTGLWWAVQESIQDGSKPWTALTDSVLEMVKKVVRTEYPSVDPWLVPEEMRRGRLSMGRCPRCGDAVIEGKTDFGCSGYTHGCGFVIRRKADSGLMKRTELSADQVHLLLKDGWVPETRTLEDGSTVRTGRMRTAAALECKKLYSEKSKNTFAGTVYLCDNGRESFFAVQEFSAEPPASLGKCPRCGCDVVEGKLGYGCSGYKEGCKFVIWKKSKMKLLANCTITKTDAKKFLAAKPVHKKKLADKKGRLFEADLILVDEPDQPYGPVFRVVQGSIAVAEGEDAAKIDTPLYTAAGVPVEEPSPIQKVEENA